MNIKGLLEFIERIQLEARLRLSASSSEILNQQILIESLENKNQDLEDRLKAMRELSKERLKEIAGMAINRDPLNSREGVYFSNACLNSIIDLEKI